VASGDDGLLDGVQEVTVRTMARLRISKAFCSSEEMRPEVSIPTVVLRVWRRTACAEGSGGQHAYHGVQEVKASLVARIAWSRCPGASAISHRSFRLAVARSGQGRSRRPGARSGKTRCQVDALS
jgi:hypothetical protein